MTTTQTAGREDLSRMISELPDEAVPMAIEFIKGLEGHTPNAETMAVLRDSEAGRDLVGPFDNMKDFMESLLSDDNA